MNSIKPDHVQQVENNAHFNVCRSIRRQQLVSVTYLIPRLNIKKEALFIYLGMVFHSSKEYLTYRSLMKKLDSLYGAKLSVSHKIFERDISITFSIVATDDAYLHTIKNLSMEAVELLNALINNGISRDESTLNAIKEHACKSYEEYVKSDEYTINQGINDLFKNSFKYKEYMYDSLEAINSVSFTDIEAIISELSNCTRFVTYIGDEKASTAIKLKHYFKPTPFIPRVRTNDLVINKVDSINLNNGGKKLYIAYRYPSINGEATLLFTLVMENILKHLINDVLKLNINFRVNYNLFNGLVVIEINDLVSSDKLYLEKIKELLASEFIELDKSVFNKEMKVLKTKLQMIKEDDEGRNDFIVLTTYLAISKKIDDYLDKVEKLSIEDFKSFLVHCNFIGDVKS